MQRELAAQADVVARARPQQDASLLGFAERLETVLADAPCGFVHGDFFSGNLLVENRRLAGVIDWEQPGQAVYRLSISSIFALLRRRLRTSTGVPRYFGSCCHDRVPKGDDVAREACERVGLEVDRERLEALTVAYSLDYVSGQLSIRPYLLAEPLWLGRNIDLVLRGIGRESLLARVSRRPQPVRAHRAIARRGRAS